MSSALPKAPRRGLADEAADLVRAAIFSGHFPPGAALREVELAAHLDVSRGSVREGLAQLEREGLVRSGWHRGTTVIDVTAQDVEEVYTLRAALDRLAATTARRTATSEQLSRLDQLIADMAAEIAGTADTRRLVTLDIAFHDQIYTAAGNGRLTTAWQAIRSQLHLFQLRRADAGYDHYRARVVDEHRELAALLRSGDRRTLARLAEEHVDSARRSLLAGLPD
ncbi:GntR family transcriptional regulator [Streptomyces iranensis]|uniref:DNA-binding GntR family transcriptional regulator n=1 Tax=Streptomyces iranensis TaxID=576784 RepID=A0A060ZBQ3_9ACTN|nr:GntR family transcriptional regulator [Streptomyces iranensis]MBP2063341.1 DNA-binding GntR family transcriptional regulator [Streptomyces iranensis]CDR01727.1 transcriptional regulator, GntR family [Streptomyces iranensis]